MKTKAIILSAALAIISFVVKAQTSTEQPVQQTVKKVDSKRIAILLVPQYIFINGLRIDFDLKLKKTNRLVIAPQFYVRENPSDNDYKNVKGVGLTIHDKIILNSSWKRQDFYFGYGATYNFSSFDDADSLKFNINKNYKIHKIGPDVLIGFQFSPIQQLIIDTYLGLAVRYSFKANDNEIPTKYSDKILDSGYTGVTPLCGIKIGLFL